MPPPPDPSPLARHRAGDPQAFAELVARHQAALLRLARTLLGPGIAAEDAVQEAFLRLAQRPPSFSSEPAAGGREESARLASWLYTVTRNICMDVLRAETRRKSREREVAAGEACDGGQDRVEAADTRAWVERRIAALPIEQREVLVLRLLLEKSYREIAEITGKSVGTVGWLLSIGVKALGADMEARDASGRTDISTDAGVARGGQA